MPPGAPNPLVAAPLLSAAASALAELHNKEESESQRHLRQGMSGMMPPAFGFGGWPGVPHMGFIPGAGGAPGAPGHMRFIPGAATYRPTPTKAPFAFDALIAPLTASAAGGGAHPMSPGSAAAAACAAAAAAAAGAMAGPVSTGVDCTVELVPMPGAGSSTDPAAAGGSTVRTVLNFALLTSFDALHCSLASVVGAPPPAGGRHDPSALQIVYCDASGAPAVLGGESWQLFLLRARSVHARLLVPIEEALKNSGEGVVPAPAHASPPTTASAPASAPAHMSAPAPAPAHPPHQAVLPPPFAEMQTQWATMGLDPNIMMAMMMYAAAASAGNYHNAQ
jgi:hypothetical protein